MLERIDKGGRICGVGMNSLKFFNIEYCIHGGHGDGVSSGPELPKPLPLQDMNNATLKRLLKSKQ